MRVSNRWAAVAVAALVLVAAPAAAQELALEAPAIVLSGVSFDVEVRLPGGGEIAVSQITLRADGRSYSPVVQTDGTVRFAGLRAESTGRIELELLQQGRIVATGSTRSIPGWLSILPPILAIAIALIFKQVVPALFVGLWLGASSIVGFGPMAIFRGMLDTFQLYVLNAVTDPDHASVILFSFMIGGMVGIVIKNGGMQGVVNIIVRWATSPRRGQVMTGILGLVIFFDDYANTLVVGNTMRQVTDRLRISREKLAYIVDSTAAPVASVALVTTWIGYEVGLIGTAMDQIGLQLSPYSVFLNSIPYAFYPVLTIFFVFMIANSGRDFGPMLAAESRARTTGMVLGPGANVDPAAAGDSPELRLKDGKPVRAVNAVLPIAAMIAGVLSGLYFTGQGETLRDVIGSADSYKALMWGSMVGVMVAVLLTIGQRILSAVEVIDAWYAGIKSMLFAMIILVLAWSLAGVSEQLHTADYLVSVLSDSLLPALVPTLIFVLASATAFATGSSWATMGILMPLVVPLVWAVLQGAGAGGSLHLLYSTVACVLAGSVLGDHCSPISDTTILSSMASGCDHLEHVRTQLPYALTVGVVAVLAGTLPTGFGVPWWLCLPLGAGVLFAVVRFIGRPVSADRPA